MRMFLAGAFAVSALYATPVAHAAEAVSIRDVDMTEFPTVTMTVSSDAGKPLSTADVTVSENGRSFEPSTVEPLAQAGERVDVVLTIDTSGSMEGEPMASALAAAVKFVTSVPDEIRVGLVTFSDKAHVVVPVTDDRARVLKALGKLEATGETSLYDGVVQASKMFAADGQHNMVLLSDGADTTSRSKLKDALAAAKANDVSIFAVGLTSGEFDENALRTLGDRTRGSYAPAATADLSSVYEGIATELGNQWVVSYESAATDGGQIDLGLSTPAGSDSILVLAPETTQPAPVKRARPEEVTPPNPILAGETGLAVVLATTFGALFLVAYMVIGTKAREQRDRKLRARLLQRTAHPVEEKKRSDQGPMAWMPDGLVRAAEKLGEGSGFTEKLDVKLERAGLPVSPGEFLVASVLSAIAAGIAGGTFFSNIVFALVVAAVGAFVPHVFLTVRMRQRGKRLQAQLADILMVLASSLRAGHSFFQAVDLVSKEVGEPASTEFKRVVTEVRLGRSVDDAMNALAERVGSDDFKWAMLAVNIQRQVGGNLAEVLDQVADTLRERETIRRQIQTLAAEGQLSIVILTALPILVALYMFKVSPDYISLLFTTTVGIIMTAVAAGLMCVGVFWMRKVVKIDV